MPAAVLSVGTLATWHDLDVVVCGFASDNQVLVRLGQMTYAVPYRDCWAKACNYNIDIARSFGPRRRAA